MGQIAMPIVNQFVTAADFWSGMVEPDYHAHKADVASLRAALHVAISLFHMSDWVFHTHETQVRAAFTFEDAKSHLREPVRCEITFADALEQTNADFGRLRGICHATKHLRLRKPRPVKNAPSDAANTRVQTTGFGIGGFGSGPMGGTARVMVEGAGGADMEFSAIAQNVHTMWLNLNGVHRWW